MRRHFGQRLGDRTVLSAQVIEFRCKTGARERAGLVEDHRFDLGEAFQRGAGFDEEPFAIKPSDGRRGHGRDGKAQRAGACDDQNGDGDIQRLAQVAGIDHPACKGQRGKDMHHGRIEGRGTVGQRGIAVAHVLGGFDQPCHLAQASVISNGHRVDLDGCGEVNLSGAQHRARTMSHGFAFSGQERAIRERLGANQSAIGGHAHAGGDKDAIPDSEV